MYGQTISRCNRTAFVLALDQSGSMAETVRMPSGPCTKAEALCEAANTMLFELVARARRSDGIHDYYDIAAVGYSGRGVRPLLDPEWFLSVDRLDAVSPPSTCRMEERYAPDGRPLLIRTQRIDWITPCAEGQTPAYAMFCDVFDRVEQWCADPRHTRSFPPVIFNITDGEASDCSPDELLDICRRIRELKTGDGNVLLLNCHLSSNALRTSILFPTSRRELGQDRYARLLYDCSSTMPACFEPEIREMKEGACGPFRGMSYNCSIHEATALLQIGSNSVSCS